MAQVRFARHVYPGETLAISMWAEGDRRVIFQTLVVERGEVAISNAAVEFKQGCLQRPAGLGSSKL